MASLRRPNNLFLILPARDTAFRKPSQTTRPLSRSSLSRPLRSLPGTATCAASRGATRGGEGQRGSYFPSLYSIDLEDQEPQTLFRLFLLASLSDLSALVARAEGEAECYSSWSLASEFLLAKGGARSLFLLDEAKATERSPADSMPPLFVVFLFHSTQPPPPPKKKNDT